MNITRGSIAAIAGVVGAGVLAFPVASAAFGDDDTVYKREDRVDELVLVDDDDLDDDPDDAEDLTHDRTGVTAPGADTRDSTRDNTRDGAQTRDDTRDNTRDGAQTRDNTRDNTRDGAQTRDNTRDNTRG